MAGITRRRWPKEAVLSASLEAREELLRVFVKNVPAAVAMLDRDMRYVQVSDRWRTDYLSGREHVEGCSHYEVFPDMPERWKEVHRRGLQGETLRAEEDRWEGRDGAHWARWEVRPWKTPEGTVGGILILTEDITDRKRAEQELSKANERLRLALEAGSTGGWEYNLKTGENIWFGAAHAQIGMTPDETSGSRKEFWSHVHEDDRERLRSAFAGALEKREQFNEDFRVVWRDGTIHWLRSRGRYQYAANGEPERMFGISVDITSSKQAEQALRESEQRFRLAAEAGKMYSFEWDLITDEIVRSPEHVKVLGSTGLLHSTHRQFLRRIHSDDRPRLNAAIAGLTPEHPATQVIYRVQKSDGNFVWLRSSGRGFFDSSGKLARVIGMVADITDLKRTEAALSDMTRRLFESQEQERTRIGRELHDDISQRLALLSIELQQLGGEPSAPLRNRAQKLRSQVDEICADVEALSHDLHSSKLEYLGVIAGMRSWCREYGERRKMKIAFSSDVNSPLPFEIGLSLFRVLQEALHNAAKHSGVKRIEVELSESSGEIHLAIRDVGKGFDVEAVKQGRGLGLTSMQERVRLVNGTMTIDSKPMRGTTIHVRVPFESERLSQRVVG